MRVFLNAIKNVLIIVLLLGFITAGVDYARMNSGDVPIFNISSYNQKSNIQTYRGLFYIAERKVKASISEPLVDSSNMQYKILVFDLNVPRKFNTVETFTVETKVTENCHEDSKLYYADLKIKVYTYCLDSIKIENNGKSTDLDKTIKKNSGIIDDIDNKLALTGVYKDNKTLMFIDKENELSSNGLTMYRCNDNNINDVYFAPSDTPFREKDFCTYKDDDLKFIFKIVDESEKPTPEVDEEGKEKEIPKETFYSDEKYDYQFEYQKSDKVYVVAPASRGRSEKRYLLKEVLDNNMLTLDELKAKGLKFDKVEKETNDK